MTSKLTFLVAVATVGATACASTPTAPSIMALPGAGKTHEQFRTDDARCRKVAATELQTTPPGTVPAQGRYDIVYSQCMYAEGNLIPVPGRGWRSRDLPPSTLPRGVPEPPSGTPPAPPPAPAR